MTLKKGSINYKMHKFSEFASTVHFVGDKISINKILNKEINVLHYKIEPSKSITRMTMLKCK